MGEDSLAEAAFAALVRRHGPMVSRELLPAGRCARCRRRLPGGLPGPGPSRRFRSPGESAASWLLGRRTTNRARASKNDAARRRKHERRRAEMAMQIEGGNILKRDLGRAHEEIDRLPELYQRPWCSPPRGAVARSSLPAGLAARCGRSRADCLGARGATAGAADPPRCEPAGSDPAACEPAEPTPLPGLRQRHGQPGLPRASRYRGLARAFRQPSPRRVGPPYRNSRPDDNGRGRSGHSVSGRTHRDRGARLVRCRSASRGFELQRAACRGATGNGPGEPHAGDPRRRPRVQGADRGGRSHCSRSTQGARSGLGGSPS